MTDSSTILELDDISKRYSLNNQNPFILSEILRIMMLRKRAEKRAFWAVKDLSVSVKRGQSLGIIGTNGAGKSTLMSLIAGSVFPTKGRVRVKGRVGALLELGAGFHSDLTGRENIYLNASLLGLTKNEIDAKFEQILDFSELHDFIDVQIRNYSSGMHVRLGFSVAVHIDPEIILIDEALAVGDQHFQEKCVQKIMAFKEDGKTLVFVSHNMLLVQLLCDRVVWMQDGMKRLEGVPDLVIPQYKQHCKDSHGERHLQKA